MAVEDETLLSILSTVRTIAVVGLSDKPERESNGVARYLRAQGYLIVPVNPNVAEVFGERSYPSLSDVPSEIRIDLVDIFRRSEEVSPVVDEAIRRGVGAIWMQLGIENEEAARRAEDRGIPVVQNRCAMREHRRLGLPARRTKD